MRAEGSKDGVPLLLLASSPWPGLMLGVCDIVVVIYPLAIFG